MPKLPRVIQRIFGENAEQDGRIAQFGSVVEGAPLKTGDIKIIQQLDAWVKGWVGALITNRRYPTAEETTGINKVVTQQLKYLFQQGIPEWHIDETYYENSFCQVDGKIFFSLTDDNIGHNPVGDKVNWQEWISGGGNSLSFGAVMSFATGEVIPAGFHAMNGEEILNASESEYATQYTRFLLPNSEFSGKTYADVCTYEEYEQMITDYGACPKFAVDSEANKFKFPNVPDGYYFKQGQGTANKGGVPDITGTFKIGAGGSPLAIRSKSGCFYNTNTGAGSGASGAGGANGNEFGFKASLSNEIYGKTTDTVETNAVGFRWYIFVANSEVGDFAINWDKLQTALPNKANVDADNFSEAGKENITSFVMPDYDNPIAEKISLENSIGTPYTPTQDCYISIRAKSAKSGATNSVNIIDPLKGESIINFPCYGRTGSDVTAGAYIPKGKKVLLISATNGTTVIDRYYSVYPLKGGSN